jgi:CRP-like cAMP-binding protein
MRSRKLFFETHAIAAEIPWIQNLPVVTRGRVLDDLYESAHLKGEIVTRVGDPSHSWIYVVDGLLKVSAIDSRGKMVMYTGVPQKAWIGEGSLIKREIRRYDIVALRDTRLLHVPGATVRWLLDTDIGFNHTIISQLNERLSQYITMMDIDRMDDPVAKLARSLAMLFNPVLYPRMTAAVPLSQQELGELAGLSRSSISAALKRLQREGFVTTAYGGVVVNDVNSLRDYADSEGET